MGGFHFFDSEMTKTINKLILNNGIHLKIKLYKNSINSIKFRNLLRLTLDYLGLTLIPRTFCANYPLTSHHRAERGRDFIGSKSWILRAWRKHPGSVLQRFKWVSFNTVMSNITQLNLHVNICCHTKLGKIRKIGNKMLLCLIISSWKIPSSFFPQMYSETEFQFVLTKDINISVDSHGKKCPHSTLKINTWRC